MQPQPQPRSSNRGSAPEICEGNSYVKAILVEEEEGGEDEVSTGCGRGPSLGGGGGGTSCVGNSPLTSSSGCSAHEAQPPPAVATVATAQLGLFTPSIGEPLYREQAQFHRTQSRETEALPNPPQLYSVLAGAPGAVDSGCRASTARVMRLSAVATSLPSSASPHVVAHHTLRLRPSIDSPLPPPNAPQRQEQGDAEDGAPPSKRLRSYMGKPTDPTATPSSAAGPGGLGTTGVSDSGGRVLRLSLSSNSLAQAHTARTLAQAPATVLGASGGRGVGDGATTTTASVSAHSKPLREDREEAADGTKSTAEGNEEAQRVSGMAPPGSINASSSLPLALPASSTAPNPQTPAISAASAAASGTSRAALVHAPNTGPPLSAFVAPAVSPQQQTRPAVPVAAPSGAIGTNSFPRLRSLTPTPYPGAQGSPCRRHRFVGVSLPGAPPPPIDFGSVQRTVKEIYEVHEKLSEGTYGEVFKGVDKRTGAVVALKRLKMLSTHQGFPQTSLREVIALRHIQSQRERLEERLRNDAHHRATGVVADPLAEVSQLCDVLLFDRQQRDIVLVFAYATASLAGLCRRQFAFTPSEMAFLMKKLLVAVRKLHEMRIIHRDIKSDNVLITSEGEVQLTDFGLCSIVASGSSRSGAHVWRTPSVITLAYRPPEMLLGSTAYDEKVDVWSLGCLLAQMHLHEPPFYRHRVQAQQQQRRAPERTAATELEQLSRITEVLGPLPPVRVYHPDACQHIRVLEQLEIQGRLAESGRAAQPANWGRLQAIFEPSFLYQQFHGFRGWFEAELERSRHQPHRRPTQACMDVMCAALQLDPQQRPTAAELLRMPYFTTLDDAPLLGSYQRLLPATPEREAEVRRGFMLKVQRCGDSHTQRRPHQ
ncbi:hypothetical protein LSCM1_07548 [Leishmania martiniquensis]|uniref:Protein kinase domain-containing protein n=1 Tax=Leishmania martiniquensis TaxID=1580590 RepID=A0A836KS86_9TRYP|nr:hypothetical protein LSCM1_07548 [Leishmania martiniquensis]